MDWVERLDRWFERRYHICPIGEGGYILRLGLIRHRGRRVVLGDGTTINSGDLVAELHMDNHRAAELHYVGKGGIRFRREVLRLLPALARDLASRPEYQAVTAVCGASLFWEGAARIGFENRPFPAFTKWWLTWWERFLMARYHPAGRRRLEAGERTELRQVWIPRRVLLERYGGETRAGGSMPTEAAAPAGWEVIDERRA